MDDLGKGPPYMEDGSRGNTMIRQRAIGAKSGHLQDSKRGLAPLSRNADHGPHEMNTPQD